MPAGKTLLTWLAAATCLAALLVPVGAAGAASGCAPLLGVLGGCGTPAPPPSATCPGLQPVKADGTPWQCTFDDEFDGTALNRDAWTVQTTAQYGFHSGDGCDVDSPDTVSVADGVLDLTARRTAQPFTCAAPHGAFTTDYEAASVYTTAFAQEYGRFEIRARFAESGGQPGIQGALWLFPRAMTALAPLAGPTEIDIAEAYSDHPDLVIPTVHSYTGLPTLPLLTPTCSVPDFGAAFHTYAVQWDPSLITFSYDGTTCLQIPVPLGLPVPSPFLVALSQSLGMGRNAPNAATPMPSTLQVDYVRVYR